MLVVPPGTIPASPARAQQPAPAPSQAAAPAPAYTQAELEQALAPIALYPDDLLTQVLVASTYPLEVVMASRWLEQPANKDLKGDALVSALDGQDWDASVKSLVPFPAVLKMMSDQLDWTQKLGDMFLAQQADVLAAVQALRGRAQAAGKLQSNAQQTVVLESSSIAIQPTQPDTVYVPAYDPGVAYGSWPYPSYPPAYYPPPPGYYAGSALATGLAFGAGIAVTGALWGWGRPNWGAGSVNVDVNRFNSINSNRFNNFHSNRAAINSSTWQHNPDHRRGVAYSNPQVRQQYRPTTASNVAQRDAFRGRTTQGPSAPGGGNLQGRLPNGAQPGGGAGGNLRGNLSNAQRSAAGGNGPARPQNIQRPSGGAGGNLQGKLSSDQRPAAGGNGPARPQNIQRPSGSAGSNLQGKLSSDQRPAAGGNGLARPQNIQRPTGGGNVPTRPQNIQRPAGGGNLPARPQNIQRTAGSAAAFQGVGNGAATTRAQSVQGHASRASMPHAGGGGGGAARGGGGAHIGGRR